MNIYESYSKNSPLSACDRVADALVDAYLRQDVESRVDVKVLNAHGLGMILGSIESPANIIPEKAALEAGEKARKGMFSEIVANLSVTQRDEIKDAAQSVRAIVRGYATAETSEMLPRAQAAAERIARAFDDWREDRSESVDPNMYALVRVVTDRASKSDILVRIFGRAVETIVREEDLKIALLAQARKVFSEYFSLWIEAGETGSEIFFSGERACVRGYEGIFPENGGAMSGKDPRHPFRAGTLMARFVAKTLVAEGAAKNCLITAVYDGGEAPTFINARDGNGRDFTPLVEQKFNFRVPAIIERFQLARPMYEPLAHYGPFFASDAPWEKV